MSVRELEQMVRDLSGLQTSAPDVATTPVRQGTRLAADPAVRRLEDDLRKHFQTDVRVQVAKDGKGKIELSFYSNDDLARLIELFTGGKNLDF